MERDASVIKVDNAEYEELMNYVSTNNLANEAHYRYVKDRVDVDNFALYYTSQIYFDNQDWPSNNIKYWKTSNGKWRWILFDTDFGFGICDKNNYRNNTLSFALDNNGPGWPNPPWSTGIYKVVALINGKRFSETVMKQ